MFETMRRVRNDPPPAPRSLRPDLPRDLEAIILSASKPA